MLSRYITMGALFRSSALKIYLGFLLCHPLAALKALLGTSLRASAGSMEHKKWLGPLEGCAALPPQLQEAVHASLTVNLPESPMLSCSACCGTTASVTPQCLCGTCNDYLGRGPPVPAPCVVSRARSERQELLRLSTGEAAWCLR